MKQIRVRPVCCSQFKFDLSTRFCYYKKGMKIFKNQEILSFTEQSSDAVLI